MSYEVQIQSATPVVGMKEGERGVRTLQLQSHCPWPASQAHSSGLWWLCIQRYIERGDLSCPTLSSPFVMTLAPLLSSVFRCCLCSPLTFVRCHSQQQDQLAAFLPLWHGVIQHGAVSVLILYPCNPVFQGSCLLYFWGLKKKPQNPVRKQPCSEEF